MSDCSTCGHYQLKLMISSDKPYGYAGDIPCLRCSRYFKTQDLHTNQITISNLHMTSMQHANPDKFILETIKGIY